MVWRVTTLLSGPQIVGGGINYLHFGEAAGSALTAHAAAVEFWQTIGVTMQAGNSAVIQSEVEQIDVSTGLITGLETTDVVTQNGGNSDQPLPPAVQGLLRFRTGIYNNGREMRGRLFLPAMAEANSPDGKPSSALQTIVNGAISALVADEDSLFSVYSRTHHSAAVVAGGNMWGQWAVLRGRRD